MIYLKDNKFFCDVQVRVRYAETDKMGYVYYGNYLTYYEVARTQFLREFGFTYRDFEENGYMLPVASVDIKYIKAATYDDLLTIRIFHKYYNPIKLDFYYEVYNHNNELLNTGNSLLIFVDAVTRRPKPGPNAYIEKLKSYFDKLKEK